MGYRLEQQDARTRDALVALGGVFLELRRSRGMTQRRLASRSGLSQSSISRLETGRAPWLSAVWIARLLVGLDLTPGELGFGATLTPSDTPGWRLLIERFSATRRRRELRAIAAAEIATREQRMLEVAGSLRESTPKPR